MFLSIVIPAHNAEKYLAECLNSCIHQDVPSDEYEIIAINDGSEDSSLKILEKYAEKTPNIIVKNRNCGGGKCC